MLTNNMLYNKKNIGSDIVEKAHQSSLKAKWEQNGSTLMRNHKKYGEDMEISEYNKLLFDNICKAGRDIILGINRDTLYLHLLLIRRDVHSGSSPHLFSIFDLTNNTIITSFSFDDDFNINTKEQLLKAVPKIQWRQIMKSTDAFFFRARLPEKGEVEDLVNSYTGYFFSCPSEDSSYSDHLDMYSRYGLYVADLMNYFTDEQKEGLKLSDDYHLSNYVKGIYDRHQNNLNTEIDLFFDWLIQKGAVA